VNPNPNPYQKPIFYLFLIVVIQALIYAGSHASGRFSFWIFLVFEIGFALFFLRDMARKSDKIESLKQDKKELSLLITALQDAILVIDRDQKPLIFNSKVATIWPEMKSNSYFWQFCRHNELLECVQKVLSLDDGQAFPVVDLGKMEILGDIRYFSVSISPIPQEGGKPAGAILVCRDTTQLKKSDQIRVDFVANASHELRTPITAIKGYVDTLLLDAKQGRPAETEFLEIISKNANRLMNLIQDLLDLSSLDSSSELNREIFGVQDLLERVSASLRPKLEKRQQSIEKSVDVREFHGDVLKIEQILVNLIENASKYSGNGTVIKVSWRLITDLRSFKQMHEIRIQDQGPGISQEHLGRLFERFYRVDRGRSRDAGGTGLGLAIVKHIVQLHSGEVLVESEVGKGSTFICRLPLTKPQLS